MMITEDSPNRECQSSICRHIELISPEAVTYWRNLDSP